MIQSISDQNTKPPVGKTPLVAVPEVFQDPKDEVISEKKETLPAYSSAKVLEPIATLDNKSRAIEETQVQGYIISQTKAPGDGFLEAKKQDILQGLLRYHNLNGNYNGSPSHEVQLPPVPGANSPAALPLFLDSLSEFVASSDFVAFKQGPTDPAERKKYREQIAREAGDQIISPGDLAEKCCREIKDPEIRRFTETSLAQAPQEFFLAPSSSTGKYHPADEINKGGLCLHVRRVVEMGKILCDYLKVGSKDRDEILSGLILHDLQKSGIPWGKYTVGDHGPVCAEWLAQFAPPGDKRFENIRRYVANHMAQWNATADNKPSPTPPRDLGEQIVSYSDYIASQDNIYVQVP
ncbi:MAG: HD domain-containing protein [Armatimonadetes bacterium]|nr:HD domain-containing protein [Armatimonadota bacterium]